MASLQELEARIDKLERNLFLTYHQVTPIGVIMVFAAQTPPSGWLICNGHEYRIEEFKLLYNVIGDMYNTEETPEGFFRIPDLQGQFIRGWDGDGNVDPEREFGTVQIDTLQGHSHAVDSKCTETEGAGTHTHSFYMDEHGGGLGVLFDCLSTRKTYRAKDPAICRETCESSGFHTHSFKPNVSVLGATDSVNGKVRVSTETRPKNVALLYCIKAK